MPSLPLDHQMPIAAVFGTMLYPRDIASDREKARDYATFALKTGLKNYQSDGFTVPDHLVNYLSCKAELPKDVKKRYDGGEIAGEIFKIAFELVINEPEKASWQSAYRIVSRYRKERGLKPAGERSLREIRDQFLPASHLWAALNLRQRNIAGDERNGYEAITDLHNFLFEAEILRYRGRNWVHSRDKAQPLLPNDLWHVPHDWMPPKHEPNWPDRVGGIAHYEIDEIFKSHINARGRPRKTGQVNA